VRPHGEGGFTLIELLVVLALISLLASMAVVQYRNSIQRTQESVLKTDLFDEAVGAGLAPRLFEVFGSVTGIDVSPAATAAARAR